MNDETTFHYDVSKLQTQDSIIRTPNIKPEHKPLYV
jgi:hypothetical protein